MLILRPTQVKPSVLKPLCAIARATYGDAEHLFMVTITDHTPHRLFELRSGDRDGRRLVLTDQKAKMDRVLCHQKIPASPPDAGGDLCRDLINVRQQYEFMSATVELFRNRHIVIVEEINKALYRYSVIATAGQFVCIQVAAFDPTDHCTEVNSAVFGDFTCCQRLFFPHSNLSIGNYTKSSIDSLLRLQG